MAESAASGTDAQPVEAPAMRTGDQVVTESVITEKLGALLDNSDLQQTTERMLRKELEKELGDLKAHKELIRDQINAYLESQRPEDAEADRGKEDVKPAPQKRRKGGFGVCQLSEPLSELLDRDVLPRNKVVQKLWAYIREHGLQNPKDKRKIVLDDALEKIFKPPLTMFTMNTQLSKHCFPAEPGTEYEPSEGEEDEDAEDKPKKRRRKAQPGEKKQSGFSKEQPVSQELADWMGLEQPLTTRGQMTKFFWRYVKDKGLQDPDNKKTILCDSVLESLTGEASFHGFAAGKYLGRHFLKSTGKEREESAD